MRFICFGVIVFLFTSISWSQASSKNSLVFFRVINAVDGKVIEEVDAAVSLGVTDSTIQSLNIGDSEFVSLEKGIGSTSLVGAQEYRASLIVKKGGVPVANGVQISSGGYFLVPKRAFLFKPESYSKKFIDFLLQPASSMLEVQALDSQENALETGYVQAFSLPDTEKRATEHLVGDYISDGKVSLPLLPGRSYVVTMGTNASGFLPASEQVVLVDGERRSLIFRMRQPDHKLRVQADVNGDLDLRQSLSCFAFNDSGERASADSQDLQVARLEIGEGQWQVGCQLLATKSTQPRLFEGRASYLVPQGLSAGDKILLLDKETLYYPEEVFEFQAEDSKVIVAPDGMTSIEFPSQSIAAEGSVKLHIESGSRYTTKETAEPILAFDISLFVNGVKVERTLKPILLSLPVAESRLQELGVLAEDVYAAWFNPDTGQWQVEPSSVYDPTTKTLKVYVTHFSIWGVLIDLSKKLARSVPDNLRARVSRLAKGGEDKKDRLLRRRSFVRMRWDAPLADARTKAYKLQIAQRKRQKTGIEDRESRFIHEVDWSSARPRRLRKRSFTTRLRKGSYQFRVSAEEGQYSTPRQFRVR